MTEYFDTGHHGYMEKRSADFARFVVDRIWQPELDSYNTCIELGAGIGRFTPPLVERFDRVCLIEPANAYAKVLEERFASARVTVSSDSAEQFLEDWPQDEPVLLTAFHLLHHLTLEQRQSIYAFLIRTRSHGVFVEPNPWNPLILLQVLVTPGMNFDEERQYLQLTRARMVDEIQTVGLMMQHYRKIVALPPGVTDICLSRKRDNMLRLAEGLTVFPCAASYHSYHLTSQESADREQS